MAVLLLLPMFAWPQETVTMNVDAATKLGKWKPVWSYFGYDEPNYTYMPHGRKLVSELVALSPVPVHIRAHNLLTTGDGTPALKWGSTNAYTEDASGRPVYNWTIVDRIFDTYRDAGAKPFVEIGFMPQALSTKPEPYQHNWPTTPIDTGWAYPAKDYKKWAELTYQLAKHCAQRYGQQEAESWYWEVWNEPDIFYWHGTPAEYNELYDYAVDAVRRALPGARVGGPATTSPRNPKAAEYLRQFLDHCARGKNYPTGKTGSPLDFVSYHAKGSPRVVEDHVQMSLANEMQDVSRGLEILTSFAQFKNLPIILSEADPEGCAACSSRTNPRNGYRNGSMYPSYTAAALGNIIALADRHQGNIEGMLTWAFEFEGQPYFDGFRTLATNGVDKPVLNVFRMLGLMKGDRVKVESTGAVGLDAILSSGVRSKPDVDGIATLWDHGMSVLAWNYHDDDLPGADVPVHMNWTALPAAASRVLVRHYRIDETYSNAYTVWKQMGSPQQPTPEQTARLEAAGQLELLESPRWISVSGGRAGIEFALPRHGVSLLEVTW